MVAVYTVRRCQAGWIGENPPLPDAWSTEAEFRDSRAQLVAMEDTMSDLYAINRHVQERLERDWREGLASATPRSAAQAGATG